MNIKKQLRAVKRAAAFTLAEVVVSVGIIGFLFGTVYLTLGQSMRVIENARENLRATQVIQEVTEVLRLYSWGQITQSNYVPSTFVNYFDPSATNSSARGVVYYGQINMQVPNYGVAYTNTLREVTVSVSWTNRSIPHTRSLTTIVSQYGLQRYIY